MPKGVYIRTQETIEKNRRGHLGKFPSDDTRKKLSISHSGTRNGFYGKHHTEETKIKNREAHLGKTLSDETKRKIGLVFKGENSPNYGRHHSEETRNKISLAITGRHLSEEHKLKLKIIKTGNKLPIDAIARHKQAVSSQQYKDNMGKIKKQWWDNMSPLDKVEYLDRRRLSRLKPEIRKRRSELSKEMWSNPLKKSMIVKATMQASHARPNLAEAKLLNILEKNAPEYKYTGDGSMIIGGHCPDFTNINGQKKVILLHGIYWHLLRFNKKNPLYNKEMAEIKDIEHYKKFGFNTLIVWEDELINESKVIEIIKKFNESFIKG